MLHQRGPTVAFCHQWILRRGRKTCGCHTGVVIVWFSKGIFGICRCDQSATPQNPIRSRFQSLVSELHYTHYGAVGQVNMCFVCRSLCLGGLSTTKRINSILLFLVCLIKFVNLFWFVSIFLFWFVFGTVNWAVVVVNVAVSHSSDSSSLNCMQSFCVRHQRERFFIRVRLQNKGFRAKET